MMGLLELLPQRHDEIFEPTDMAAERKKYRADNKKIWDDWLHNESQERFVKVLRDEFSKLPQLLIGPIEHEKVIDSLMRINRAYRKLGMGVVEARKLELHYGVWIDTVTPVFEWGDLDKYFVKGALLEWLNNQISLESD